MKRTAGRCMHIQTTWMSVFSGLLLRLTISELYQHEAEARTETRPCDTTGVLTRRIRAGWLTVVLGNRNER